MISVDFEERSALIIAVEDGHRTTITLAHQDGVILLQKLTEYYGQLEFGQGTDERPVQKGFISRLVKKYLPHL